MKNIHTLIRDVYHVVEKDEGWFDAALAERFSGELGLRLVESLKPRTQVPSLRLSQMGPRCQRQLWASIHSPESEERLPPAALIKFTFGHLVESLALAMAKAAGHEVMGEQDEIILDGVKGHRDCVIDGCIVDVKSCSTMALAKLRDKTIAHSDSFGYLDQLDGYATGSLDDALVRVKDKAYLWGVDKTLGNMALYEHRIRPDHIRQRINEYRSIVSLPTPPRCTCGTVPYGEAGNIALDTRASYSGYKHYCFPHLRTFLYAKGPVFLTKVVKRPQGHVTEVDKEGRIVYN